MDERLQRYCNLIVECLVHYGRLEESAAQHLVDESSLCAPKDELGRLYLYHEFAYYWAMMLLHAKSNPEWYLDPTLWPPPEDYYDPEWRLGAGGDGRVHGRHVS